MQEPQYSLPQFITRPSTRTVLLLSLIGVITLMSGILGNPYILLSLGFLLLLFPLSIIARKTSLEEYLARIPVTAKTALTGSTCALLISFFMWSIRTIIHVELLSLVDLLKIDFRAILVLTTLIISVQGLHLLLYYLHKKVVAHADNNTKFIFYFTSLITILGLTGLDPRVMLIYATAYVIYSLLLDLFIEAKRANLIWLILWTIIIGSFLTIAIVDGTNSFIIKTVPVLEVFTTFSLIFILSALLYSLYGIINRRDQILPQEWSFNYGSTLHLRNRIQLSILLTLVFSFIAIGVISIWHYHISDPEASIDLHTKFIQALLNAYVFLFLIGFSISFSLSQYIRNPLIELGKTIGEVKLTQGNKKIKWSSNDEIGGLINEYNKMIDKLEVNASMLAHVERDNAWREMAKQVAHEIKNPLTPMKLSLQHLQRSIQSRPEEAISLTQRMCETLMNQVINLQQIADEFSNFGSLPQSENKRILLNDVVEQIHDLFRNREDMDIHLIEPIDDIGVYADKNQLIRVLNNIVKNSIQAIPENKKGYIELKLWKQDNKAIISVRDNGIGISEDQKEKIFKPSFTTKSSGSGLGLAIAANMIDSMGGTIHFKSIPDVGTEFFIELPMIRSSYYKDKDCLLYTSPSPRDLSTSRMPSSA